MQNNTHPSQIFKFCPKCGQAGFTFDGNKAFNCHACQFRFYINACGAVAVILVLPDGKIVLTRRRFEPSIGAFDLPGGFIDINERAEDAVRREIQEELGIELQSMEFLATFPNQYEYRGITYFTIDMAFICNISDASALKPADDVTEAVVVNPAEIDYATISFPSIVKILKKYVGRDE